MEIEVYYHTILADKICGKAGVSGGLLIHEAKANDTKQLQFMPAGEIGTRSRSSNEMMIMLLYCIASRQVIVRIAY
jgi:hypothetical protein